MDTTLIHIYVERLANLLRNEARNAGAEYGLQPVQLEALNYLNLCNRYSNTPLGVTEYLGLTKGTVSQSIKILENKGLVEKRSDKNDKRIVHLKVTPAGKRLLKRLHPSKLLNRACDDSSKQQALAGNLKSLLVKIQKETDLKTFGVCHTCRYNQAEENGKFKCGLTQERLTKIDIDLICREHAIRE